MSEKEEKKVSLSSQILKGSNINYLSIIQNFPGIKIPDKIIFKCLLWLCYSLKSKVLSGILKRKKKTNSNTSSFIAGEFTD